LFIDCLQPLSGIYKLILLTIDIILFGSIFCNDYMQYLPLKHKCRSFSLGFRREDLLTQSLSMQYQEF